MDATFYAFTFAASAALLYVSGSSIVSGVMRLSRALHVREFIVAFFVMAAAASLPNLFLGITSALDGIPELSLGDVFGNNFIAMTLAVAAAVLFSPKKEIGARGKTITNTTIFTFAAAVLPLILLADGSLSRIDGLVLIGFFFFYVHWLSARHELFSKEYQAHHPHASGHVLLRLNQSVKDVTKIAISVAILVVAALGIVVSANFFANHFGVTLALVGLLLTGLGNSLPEIYFAVISARRGETSLILGNLMGSVIFPATIVLGVVALIHPIHVENDLSIFISRVFLAISAILFLFFVKSKHKITYREAMILLALYAAFIFVALSFR